MSNEKPPRDTSRGLVPDRGHDEAQLRDRVADGDLTALVEYAFADTQAAPDAIDQAFAGGALTQAAAAFLPWRQATREQRAARLLQTTQPQPESEQPAASPADQNAVKQDLIKSFSEMTPEQREVVRDAWLEVDVAEANYDLDGVETDLDEPAYTPDPYTDDNGVVWTWNEATGEYE